MSAQDNLQERSSLIDAIRGAAVLGMIIAHSIFFLHDGTQLVLNTIQGILNITVFTIFLFVSGLATSKWLTTLSSYSFANRTKTICFKTLSLYAGYIMVATIATFSTGSTGDISRVLLFLQPPNFTEYFVLFILLTLLLIPLYTVIRTIYQSAMLVCIVSIVSYSIGLILYATPFPPLLNELKALVAGGEDMLRFPLLFFSPIFLFGLWWQYTSDTKPKSYIAKIILILVPLFVVCIYASNIWTRWPPSLGNLSLGLLIGILLHLIIPLMQVKSLNSFYELLTIVGRHSFDLWILHLFILFGYQRFVGQQYSEIFRVILGILFVFSLSIALSSLTLRKQPSFFTIGPLGLSKYKRTKFQARYILFISLLLILFMFSIQTQPSNSIYGNIMPTPQIRKNTYSNVHNIAVAADKKWYIKQGTRSDTVVVTVTFTDAYESLVDVQPSDVVVKLDGQELQEEKFNKSYGVTELLLSSSKFAPKEYVLTASIAETAGSITSNDVMINITEPFQIAWTFDWEGWDVSDNTLQQITFFSGKYQLPFTHFISPRTFLTTSLAEERKKDIIAYLLQRHESGDELAMHLHMHYDLVKGAGITPKTSNAWGLFTKEGYDIPTTEYSPADFRQIIQFARSVMRNNGFPELSGYRSGGWFINEAQLAVLEEEQYKYDSSGRIRPKSGAFSTTPWNLPLHQQPYYPSNSDQNVSSNNKRKLMEIPNMGGSTYELTSEEIINNIRNIHNEGVLTNPKALVIVSHPQFATREFSRIPEVLSYLKQISRDTDMGPAIFVTMSDIHSLWETLLP